MPRAEEVFGPVRDYVEAGGRTWRSSSDLEDPLFRGWGRAPRLTRQRLYQIITAAAARAGIQKPVHPHTLRHTFATHFVIAGGNPVALAEILGHSSLDYVQTYVHLGRMITGQGYRATWLEGS
jgi:site-specific recombinase XerD